MRGRRGSECPGADLALTMIGQPNPVILGQFLTYTITVTNNGPSTAKNVLMTHQLPEQRGFRFRHLFAGHLFAGRRSGERHLGYHRDGNRRHDHRGRHTHRSGDHLLDRQCLVHGNRPRHVEQFGDGFDAGQSRPRLIWRSGSAASPSPGVLGATLTYTVSVTNSGTGAMPPA